ncbi:hypothetical protein HU200_006562 [Digitaria exilis]|uniref:Alpha/beta hydrolase fold-3 domain-containing protein n=1 Tax=Digitaria exilis TaxID=1010633 RepID=A0A835FRD8_9POAL|nr:hypothetical protein HU200_006562 [Digitaria exilis]CAB3483249.1 unnamed protein product [Digitaria exilis]
MDPDTEVDVDLSPYLIRYKSGRVRRLISSPRVAAGPDATTGVTSSDVAIDSTLAARVFVPSDVLGTPQTLPLLVYFHGGAFALHSAFAAAHTRLLNALVSAARVVAVSVEYRLAPEHPVPAAYDDAWAALCWALSSCARSRPEVVPWLSAHGDVARLFVAGDSAGANMAHHVALRAGRGGGLPGGARIEGIALLHPYFDGEEPLPSESMDPGPLDRQWRERWWALVCAGRYGLDHPFINPLVIPAAEWASLDCRLVMVTVGELDPTSDRGRRYVEALRGSAWRGEEAVLYEDHGEGHVFFLRKTKGRDKAKEDMIAAVASFMASSSSANARFCPSVRSLGSPGAKL